MMASPDRNSLLIQNGSNVVRMYAFEHEREHAGFLSGGADQANAWDRGNRLSRVLEHLVFEGGHIGNT